MNTNRTEQLRIRSADDPDSPDQIDPVRPALGLGFLEHLSDGVMVLDSLLRIVATNSAITEMLGWQGEELLGKPCMQFLGCQDSENCMPMCQGFCPAQLIWEPENQVEGSPTTYRELSVQCKNGTRRDVNINFSAIRLGSVSKEASPSKLANLEPDKAVTPEPPAEPNEIMLYTLVIMHDITEQKRIERIKNQFLVTASHQLRTPLAAIKASVGFLLDAAPGKLEGPLLRLLQNIENSSLRMERLVNDLIDLANLQSGLVQLQEALLDINQLVQKAVEANQERLSSRSQPLEIVLPPERLMVRGDSVRLTKILSHLLSNASKFSSPGSPVRLKVAVSKDEASSEIIFSVSDKGQGISSEEQKLIFEKFYQSDVSENADGTGIGLGLPLARALVELHGGRLWLESVVGQGSVFYFALPAINQKRA